MSGLFSRGARLLQRVILCAGVLVALAGTRAEGEPSAPAPAAAVEGYQTQLIEGWTIHISEKLLAEHKATTEKAMELLTAQLKEIVRVVPARAVGELKKVALWVNPEYPKVPPRAEYHPDGAWLKSNGRNPAMAKCVEFTNVRIFERETKRMPWFILHELAHAYHDQVLGFEQAEIVSAYKHAVEGKKYDAVERWHGVEGKPNTIEKAYAMTNHKEYFAEDTEAYFGRNDFYPFTREELEKTDPEMVKVLEKAWGK